MIKKYDVFGIGNALVDSVCLVTDKFLEDNKIEKGLMTLVDDQKQMSIIEKIKGSNPFIQSGGSVTNSIYTLSQLGGSGYLSFLISDDEFGKLFLEDIQKSGINTGDENLYIKPGMTGSCLVLTTPDADRTMNTCLAVSSKYSSDNINFEDLALSKYLYIEGYLVTSEMAMDAIEKSISFSRKNDVKIALTFSDLSMVKYFRNNFDKILKDKIDLLFCNKNEAEIFTGEKNFKKCCDKMLSYSDLVIITMGSEGSVILSKSNDLIKIQPFEANAVDTVGAGDTFAGGFLYGINNGLDHEESGKLASALSSKVVTKLGPRLEKNIIDNIKNSMR
tara:strand:+ start:108 stop:1106 length:999 start_codon:yes stop_codon:yes gene_type:complete